MITKLQKQGYVDYTAYKGSKSDEGKAAARQAACCVIILCGKCSS